ncbi:MAG: N-acetylglucosaminyltransferase, partial [Coriobacteriales bacterium]|nr:N-acetylglucosaminyltransferase [Coriobacteriales bacterium]
FLSFILVYFALGILTTITDWNQIHAKKSAKIRNVFTFPFFMATYVPIAFIAVFQKVEWKPIPHTIVRTTADILEQK